MKNSRILIVFLLVLLIVAFFFFTYSDNNSPEKSAVPAPLSVSNREGKMLSQKYCQMCHTYPEPELLDKKTWLSQTLPNMGPRLGIFSHNSEKYPIEHTPDLPAHTYPDKKLVTQDQWQKILDYYKQAAPEKLTPPKRKKITVDDLFFKARSPDYRAQTPPMVTAIRMDPANRTIYLSDAGQNKFLVFNKDFQLQDEFNLTSTISDIQLTNHLSAPGRRNLLTTYIGDLSPSDALKGFIQPVWYNPTNRNAGTEPRLVDSLERPVESQWVDLNQDGKKDLLVNEFGHRNGSLFWLENTGGDQLTQKHTLLSVPGCIESHVADLTGDGLPDVVALCAQLTQAIYLFRNRGNGNFESEKLLQFEIIAGSSSFKLFDFNNDGYLDILYTSGDNADYSIEYKPYHGVYIYLNDGNNNFSPKWFYPMNGAYDAVADDFDKDGNPDIAAVAFFADYDRKPEEGFIYFKNEGDFSFKPYHPAATSNGRWIAMDVADWTGNGRDDIVVANFSIGPTRVKSLIQKKFTDGPHFILLENISK